ADDVPGAPPSAVLSHGFWRRAFGGDRGILGQTLRLNEQPYEIIGVLAPNTDLPQDRGSPVAPHTDVWVPMRLNPAGPFGNNHVYPTIARLARGAIARYALAESLLLATGGGALALVVGSGSVGWLTRLAPPGVPRLDNLRLDGGVFLFALALLVAVGLALAAFPLLQYGRSGGATALTAGGRSSTVGR